MGMLPFAILLVAAIVGYMINLQSARAIRADGTKLHSLSGFHGLFSALLVLVPVLTFVLLWLGFEGAVIESLMFASLPTGTLDGLGTGEVQLIGAEIRSIAGGRVFGTPEDWKLAAADRLIAYEAWSDWLLIAAVAALSVALVLFARSRVAPEYRARQQVEKITTGLMIFCATVAIFTTIGIVFALTYETFKFFQMVPLSEFLFGTSWEPQIPIREDQIAAEGAFGAVPVFLGTIVIATIALTVAVPVGLLTAIYLNEFAPHAVRSVIKPILEILAGVPTVVYGFFAILVVAPALRELGADLGLDVASNTALAAGGVMGVMLIPFISSFADDALSAVPQSLRDGALALGATRGEMMMNVLFPAAIPGIVGGVLLAVSRAIGETMIVVMAAGLIARMTINPLDSVTAVTVQIVTLLIGDTAFDSPKTLAAFALGMMLFLATLVINVFALRIVRKYREIYD
ncbi:Phosphate transport system permease protein PstC 1 [Roseibaca ekhonensis]|uniref:Phosphate transport system permease protein n=1 Tax=Roseinatronobacter ekhonensis TaxID=254356 RepID=A0A3B0MIX3_9RHOB|nr:phosphate ABC transporter permease subunit PstC [Roseibaca ekhonensis]SUZ33528.1 Phosphate transport system permease protein PstC 1 [Roseibaca ekhonensis]